MRWLTLTFLLLGCASLDPGTARQLAGLDPLTADPQDFVVSVDLPNGIGLQPGSVVLSLQARSAASGQTGGEWSLDRVNTVDGLVSYRVAPGDLPDLQAVQSMAAKWEAEDPDGTDGSLSLSVGPCRLPNVTLDKDLSVSAFLTLETDGPMLPVLRDVSVRRFLSGEALRNLPECP
ncbi:MAG: hypothetical protein AAFY31_10120 [Pseudomonadota bacterium]